MSGCPIASVNGYSSARVNGYSSARVNGYSSAGCTSTSPWHLVLNPASWDAEPNSLAVRRTRTHDRCLATRLACPPASWQACCIGR
eukprot:scaffold7660_cov154-Isochrysis_galbana.AAC.3